ncbi:MAG: ribonuclease III [Microthrixaceae bacterium]|jgi:ribonuclease-3|nr:ribonuclease III [Microthrixaceae bacterium]
MSSVDSGDALDGDRVALLAALADRIDHEFADITQLEIAFRHRSWCAENGGLASNERLEFLGDAVLQLVVTERLFTTDPPAPEGLLAQRRAALVNTRALAGAGRRIDLASCLLLGRGEAATGGAEKESILADCCEAVIGAVYLDGGLSAAASAVARLLGPEIAHVESGADPGDPKSRLQEFAAHRLERMPRYSVVDAGPDHAKEFSATVAFSGEVWGEGSGRTKKEAEQAAAAAALERLTDEGNPGT